MKFMLQMVTRLVLHAKATHTVFAPPCVADLVV